jgi:hypothetical protein
MEYGEMNSLSLSRKAGLFALLAGVSWTALSIASLLADEPERYLDALMFAPLLLTSLAFLTLHRLQQSAFGRFGTIAYRLSVASLMLLLVCQPVLAAGSERLNWLAFPVAAVVWLLGFLLYGISTIKANALPRWIGAAIMISEPVTALFGMLFAPISPLADHGDYSGAIGHGMIWLAIGYTLWTAATKGGFMVKTAAPGAA